MPTEELEQALHEAKTRGAEADAPEVIARLLGLPREAVIRVQYAFHAAQNMRMGAVYLGEDEIPEEVQTAMKNELRRGLTRIYVREAIEHDKPLYAKVSALVKNPRDVCNGCPFSMRCLVDSISTPERCHKQGVPVRVDDPDISPGRVSIARFSKGGALVVPLRIRGDLVTVECGHPRGKFDVDVGALWAP